MNMSLLLAYSDLTLVLRVNEQAPYLKIVFFWLSSHYYIKCLINIFCSILDCIGHVLLILVWIQKYPVCSAIPFKSWFGVRSCHNETVRTEFQLVLKADYHSNKWFLKWNLENSDDETNFCMALQTFLFHVFIPFLTEFLIISYFIPKTEMHWI